MSEQPDVADLLESPRARWVLAWLAAAPADVPVPRDSSEAATTPVRHTRLWTLRDNTAGLAAEIHTRLLDWRYHAGAHAGLRRLGPGGGYVRHAEALLAAPAARWWREPLRRHAQTWVCDEPGVHTGTGLPFSTNYAHHWDATAPVTAVTTSTRLPRLPAMALLPDPDLPPGRRPPASALSAWDVRVTPQARVFEVHGPADWTRLVSAYPSHRTNLCQSPPLDREWLPGAVIWTPDWHAISRDYDGVHLSPSGWLTACSQPLPMPDRDGHTVCEGWASESTVWFRPRFEPFQRLPCEGIEYGYGRPDAGSPIDLAWQPAAPPWWRPGRRREWRRALTGA